MGLILSVLTSSLVVWSVLGIVVGVGTRILDNQPVKGGIAASLILGIIGANVVGFITKIIMGPSSSALDLFPLLAALIGSIVFVMIQRIVLKDFPEEPSPQPSM